MANKLGIVWIIALAVGLALPVMVATSGCGRGKQRTIDVAAGEYYAEDEIAELSDRKKNQYCRDLEAQRMKVQQEFDDMTADLAETNERIVAARANRDQIERDLLAVESDIRTLVDQIDEIKALPATWTIKPGESLSAISALPEIYNDVDKWWKIYEANRDKVFDPYFCFPDTVLVIPRDWPVE
jgi:nucleoid-associated protein YgaU